MSLVKNALHFKDPRNNSRRIEGEYETYSRRELQKLASVHKKPNLKKYLDSKGRPVKGNSSSKAIIEALKQRDEDRATKRQEKALREERRRQRRQEQKKQEEEDDKRFYASRKQVEKEVTFFSEPLRF